MKAVGIIPARYASTRLPGKPLLMIAGRTMIEHVHDRAQQASSLDEVYVATDDERVMEVVASFGGKGVMTDSSHPCGPDRIAEVAPHLEAYGTGNTRRTHSHRRPEHGRTRWTQPSASRYTRRSAGEGYR